MAEIVAALPTTQALSERAYVEIRNVSGDAMEATKVELSETAREALASLGSLERGLQVDLDAAAALRETDLASMKERAENVAESSDAETLASAQFAMAQQMDIAVRVQQQLTQFVMVSSVSSSFGKNLNTFLRGQ